MTGKKKKIYSNMRNDKRLRRDELQNGMRRTKPSQQFGLIEIDESRQLKEGGRGQREGVKREGSREINADGKWKCNKVSRLVEDTD